MSKKCANDDPERQDSAEGRTSEGRFAPGTSGNKRGRPRAATASTDVKPPVTDPRFDVADLLGMPSPLQRRATLTDGKVFRNDDWKNALTGQGIGGRDKRLASWFTATVLSFDQLRDLWLGDDLAGRAVETIPKQAQRAGYDITIPDAEEGGDDTAELVAEIKTKLKLLGADDILTTAGNYERAYGGGAILLGANDRQTDLTQPLNLDKVASLDYLTPLEARECIPRFGYSNPAAPKYGEPEIYQIVSRSILPSRSSMYAATTMDVHESRLLVFPGIKVSKYQATYGRSGWGEAVLSRVWRVLRDFNTAWASAGILVSDFAQTVIKMKSLWSTLEQDNGKTYEDRIALMELGRSTLNAITIDSEDSWERQQTPLSGLPDLLEKFAVRLAAACDMPLTLLFGTSPAGMNATGESDIRFFYDRVDEYRQSRLQAHLERLVQILFRVCGNKTEPAKWSLKFRPLWQDSAKDIAAAMLSQAQADTAWINAQVISPEEVAKAHWGAGEYNPGLSIDFPAREAREAVAAGPVTPDDRLAMQQQIAGYTPPPTAPGESDPNTPPRPKNNEDHFDDFNPDQPRDEHGRFGSGGAGSSDKDAAHWMRLGKLAERASKASATVEKHAAKLQAASVAHDKAKAQAAAAAKEARAAANRARRSPTPENQAAAHEARTKADLAAGKLDRKAIDLAQRTEAHAKARTAEALSGALLREAQRGSAPLPDRAKPADVHETPDFHFGAQMGAIAGEHDHPAMPPPETPDERLARRYRELHGRDYGTRAPETSSGWARKPQDLSAEENAKRQAAEQRLRDKFERSKPEYKLTMNDFPKALKPLEERAPSVLSRAHGALKRLLRVKDGADLTDEKVQARLDSMDADDLAALVEYATAV